MNNQSKEPMCDKCSVKMNKIVPKSTKSVEPYSGRSGFTTSTTLGPSITHSSNATQYLKEPSEKIVIRITEYECPSCGQIKQVREE